VALVGAGPGDPELITVKGLALLRSADVVVHDRLVPRRLLAEARRGAEVIDAGKAPGRAPWPQERIEALLIDRARRGLRVVRLKGGDPLVFGRGGEEWQACREAGIPCDVVPGVTSAVAVPGLAGIPVTHRELGRSFAVITGHDSGGSVPDHDFDALARIDTLVVLMGLSTLGEIAASLIAAGKDPSTPAACIAGGTTPGERVVTATLLAIADAVEMAGIESPATVVIGEVVGVRRLVVGPSPRPGAAKNSRAIGAAGP